MMRCICIHISTNSSNISDSQFQEILKKAKQEQAQAASAAKKVADKARLEASAAASRALVAVQDDDDDQQVAPFAAAGRGQKIVKCPCCGKTSEEN